MQPLVDRLVEQIDKFGRGLVLKSEDSRLLPLRLKLHEVHAWHKYAVAFLHFLLQDVFLDFVQQGEPLLVYPEQVKFAWERLGLILLIHSLIEVLAEDG